MTTKVLSGLFVTFIFHVMVAPSAWADSAGGDDAMLQAISGDGGEPALTALNRSAYGGRHAD